MCARVYKRRRTNDTKGYIGNGFSKNWLTDMTAKRFIRRSGQNRFSTSRKDTSYLVLDSQRSAGSLTFRDQVAVIGPSRRQVNPPRDDLCFRNCRLEVN